MKLIDLEGVGGSRAPSPSEENLGNQDALVTVARHPGDYRTARYRLGAIGGVRWDRLSGGFGKRSGQPLIYGYVDCQSAVDGEVAHSGIHGSCPHSIKVFIPQGQNSQAVIRHLRGLAGPRPIA